MTVAEIAVQVDGVVEGGASLEIRGLTGINEAQPGDITFLSNPRYAGAASVTRASAIVVNEDWKGSCPCTVVRVKNADKAFARIAVLLGPKPPKYKPGIHPSAIVADGVELGKDVTIGPYCVLEPGVKIGDRTLLCAGCYLGHGTRVGKDCRFYPHVTTREGTVIGDRVIIHNGAVIGSDGFGYVNEGGKWTKIPQVGIVVVGDDVEIGANVTVDRARFGKTVIGNGVKIDNLVQIAHNVKVGDNTAMAAQVGVSGSTVIGKNVQLGGQAGVAGHLNIGDNAVVAGQAGVTKDVQAATFVSGYPAMPHDKAKKMHAHVMLLPDLKEKVAQIEKRVAGLEKRTSAED